jgi:hypothetical protein
MKNSHSVLAAMRMVILISTSFALISQAANGDEIRRTAFADVLMGTWAMTAEQCEAKDKPNIVISKDKYADADGSCSVRWIVETAGAAGPNYAVHAFCAETTKPAKTKTVNLIIRPNGNDRISIGTTFDDLKHFLRCPSR